MSKKELGDVVRFAISGLIDGGNNFYTAPLAVFFPYVLYELANSDQSFGLAEIKHDEVQ